MIKVPSYSIPKVPHIPAVPWHATAAQLGESPRWDPVRKKVHWIDISAGLMWTASLNGEKFESRFLGKPLGAIAPGSTALAFSLGASWWSLRNDVDEPHCWGQLSTKTTRFNDCAVDAKGRLWSATMRADDVLYGVPSASLYQCAPDALVPKMHGLRAGNAMAWSPDNRYLYLVDSGANCVLRVPFDVEQGLLGASHCWLNCSAGMADGLAVDSEGGIWLAVWGTGQVRRYSATGRLEWVVDVPTPQVTAMCFAGHDMRSLIITTAAMGLLPQLHPLAGHTFIARSPIAGQPVVLWDGIDVARQTGVTNVAVQ